MTYLGKVGALVRHLRHRSGRGNVMISKAGVLGFAAISMLIACGGSSPTLSSGSEAGTTVCTPGASVACIGAGGCAGGHVCKADGSGYGACNCGAASGSAAG